MTKKILAMKSLLAALLFCLLLLAPAAEAGMLKGVEKSFKRPDGTSSRIDYGRGLIEATAIGTADISKVANAVQAETVALRTARHLAYQSLAETLGELQVNATTNYKGMVNSSDTLKVETRAFLQGARVVKDSVQWVNDPMLGRQVPKATVTVQMEFGGDGGVGKFVKRAIPGETLEKTPARTTPAEVPLGVAADLLVVDARHLPDFEAALHPRIKGEGGEAVFDVSMLEEEASDRNPSGVRYAKSLEEARTFGENPVILEAKALSAPAPGVLTISEEDAGRASQADGATHFLSKGRVVVLVNETP